MSTVLVAARADGTESTTSATRTGSSLLMRNPSVCGSFAVSPLRRNTGRSLHSPNMRALVTGGTGKLGSAIVARLRSEDWQVFAAGTKDGDLARAEPARALVERAVGRARRPRRPRQRGGSGFRAQAHRAGNGGRLGRGPRRDGQGQLLRHPGGRAAPTGEPRSGRDDRGRRRIRALAVVCAAQRGEGGPGDAHESLRASPCAGGARVRSRSRPGRGRARPGGAASRRDPRRTGGLTRGRRRRRRSTSPEPTSSPGPASSSTGADFCNPSGLRRRRNR